ncbi:hypothetical protein [Pseudomonas aeruginosa]|nr:hypothetical protein [Pseudomonas aeruginosa]ERV69949.1 hypothetical protein Q061_01733 [Pseudomonas aeruginosa BL07]
MAWANERAEGVIEDAIGTRQYDDMRRRLDAAADARQQELRSIDL